MLSQVDEQLRSEVARFLLRYTCEYCVHFEEREVGCANGYPTGPHRAQSLDRVSSLLFCKLFEMY